jgi:hypothetical protein
MSQENVERWRAHSEQLLACRSEAEWEDWLARGADIWDPAIEWDVSALGLPDAPAVCRGIEEVRQFWRDWVAPWEVMDYDVELFDAGTSVVALIEQRLRGRSTGIELPVVKYAQVATFRNGLMVHWKGYLSQTEALKAVGLAQ